MSTATVLLDEPNGDAYYLGFDLLLVRAPFHAGDVRTSEGRVVEGNEPDAEEAARHAAIKVALLQAEFAGNEAWATTVDDAERRAKALATTAGLPGLPPLDHLEATRIDLG